MYSSDEMISPEKALKGRFNPVDVSGAHLQFNISLVKEIPNTETAYVAMGCFWGAERKYWELSGVVNTAVGYQGGYTPNATYEEVCTGKTGHTEVVKVVFDPSKVSYGQIIQCFYENHNPTQGFRQGADIGTQYRSAIYFLNPEQESIAREITRAFQVTLNENHYGTITTEIAPAGEFYYAEQYHQQYLIANPNGYCGLGGTGVSCPVGLSTN
jgi:peptide-methionine (S)-S-oxide reductase